MPNARSATDRPTWDAFVAAVTADVAAVEETVRRIAELPSYRGTPLDELAPSVRRNNAVGLQGLIERRPPNGDEDLSAYAKSGEQRARQGVTLADMLHGWSIGLESARASAYRNAPESDHREALLLEAIEIMTSWNTAGMNASAAAHRAIELELARQEEHDVTNVVRRVLFGPTGVRPGAGHLESYGVDPTAQYHAVRVRPSDEFDPGAIEHWLGTSASAERRNGLAALIDGDVAGFVAALPKGDALPVAAGVAGPVPLAKLADAFRLASRALETSVAVGRRGVIDLPTLGLTPAIVADDDVGSGLLERYIVPVEREGRTGTAILDTVERYLRNNCRVPETATELDVHPNTIRYRIGRFEALTDCSLRRSESLVETWWALQRRAVA